MDRVLSVRCGIVWSGINNRSILDTRTHTHTYTEHFYTLATVEPRNFPFFFCGGRHASFCQVHEAVAAEAILCIGKLGSKF